MAVRAAITGHLVLSTLHTNDAATAIPRLLDLKVDTFLLSSALVAVLAQRLVRKNCTHCCQEYPLSQEEQDLFREYKIEQTTGYRGTGCSKCGNSGFSGRISICEVLVIDNTIRQLIFEGASTGAIMEHALLNEMITLQHDGILKAAEGITTLTEVLRVAG
jgi:type II secretory ATPase GspE/PulE/Tfp pilus assembly ATPase PilB-like protein